MNGAAPERLLWQPSPERQARAVLTGYATWLEETRGLSFDGYKALRQWSVDELEAFWESIVEFFDVRMTRPPTRVLGRREMPFADWFPGAELSYAEHVFRGKSPEQVAIVHASESADPSELSCAELSWAQLSTLTAEVAAGLRALGVQRGDRVAACLPNIPETVAAFLACASLGAIWCVCAPEFGPQAMIDRFAQIEPKLLLTIDGYRYGGRSFDRRDVVSALQAALPTLEHTVVLPAVEGASLDGLRDVLGWGELCSAGRGAALDFVQLPFDHPLWILFSSGTTGLPKAIVHGQGGILLEHLKALHLHTDLGPDDRFFWFTTTGWMMWNYLVGGLLTNAAVVLYDGSPAFPDLDRLWELAESARITCFGTSAAFLSSCMKAGLRPSAAHDLAALRSIGSTGSPLSGDVFRWVYESVGSDLWLFSMSGGTDVCTAFVGGVPTLPVHEGELQGRSLGARIEVYDEHGRPVVGEVGELVLTAPLPSMPVFLWGDTDGSRYRESYFGEYPGVWRHGDWMELTSRGTAVMHGRSDATINRGGVRMGTSEIYRAVLSLPEVADALVVDLMLPGSDDWMPLFVVPADGTSLDPELVDRIKRRIREQCSPRHVPDVVLPITEVPRTLSGKAIEIPIKRILSGVPVEQAVSREGLANPSALDYFVRLTGELGR